MNDTKCKELIRIAVVDDDIFVRELVSDHINTLDNCKVMIKAGDGQELLDKLKINQQIDLIILDIMMDGMDGYATAGFIKTAYQDMRILFYSVCKTELAIAKMEKSGGHGLIRKGGSVTQIAAAIKTVMGGYYFFSDMEEKIAIGGDIFSQKKYDKVAGLSCVETGFLQLLGTEKTYKEMANRLKINIRQVDYIRENLFRRFNVKNRVSLAIIAFQSGILPIADSTKMALLFSIYMEF